MAVSREHGVIGRLRWEGTTELSSSTSHSKQGQLQGQGRESRIWPVCSWTFPGTETAQPLLLQCLTALMEAIFSLYPVWTTAGIHTPCVSWPPPICCCDLKPLKPHPLPVKPTLSTGTPLYAHGSMSVMLGRKEMHPGVLRTLPEAEWKAVALAQKFIRSN